MNHVFANFFTAHVDLQLHDRVVNRDWLRHQVNDLALSTNFAESVHLDKIQIVARILGANQPIHRQSHSLDIDVLAVVTHRAAHIHDDYGRGFGIVPSSMDFDVFRFESNRSLAAVADNRIDERLRNIHVGKRITEFVLLR